MVKIDKELIQNLLDQAGENPRLRQNYDLRSSVEDGSQRMLNAMLPGTVVPIHRHPMSNENVILLCGKLVEVLYEEVISYDKDDENLSMAMDSHDVVRKFRLVEKERILLDPLEGKYGCMVPVGVWHTVEVLEPSVIFEAKDGKFGEDGSESIR